MLPGMLSQVRCWPKITIIKNSVWLLPAIDASRSVNTSVVTASIFNKALVDVFAFELAFVQSGIGKTFWQCNAFKILLRNANCLAMFMLFVLTFPNLQPCSQEHSKLPGRFVQEPDKQDRGKLGSSALFHMEYETLMHWKIISWRAFCMNIFLLIFSINWKSPPRHGDDRHSSTSSHSPDSLE